MAGQPLPFNAAKLTLKVQGEALDVIKMKGVEVAYRHEAHCIKRETPYRPVVPIHSQVPMAFTARIEPEDKYATLDAQGRYKLHNLFDLSVTEHTQATTPIQNCNPSVVHQTTQQLACICHYKMVR